MKFLAVVVALLLALMAVGIARGSNDRLIPLAAGRCNPVALTSAVGTPMSTIAFSVQPRAALAGIWKYDPLTNSFTGYHPQAPSDLTQVTVWLEVVSVCVSQPATLVQPGVR